MSGRILGLLLVTSEEKDPSEELIRPQRRGHGVRRGLDYMDLDGCSASNARARS